jgi:hypothetical protein
MPIAVGRRQRVAPLAFHHEVSTQSQMAIASAKQGLGCCLLLVSSRFDRVLSQFSAELAVAGLGEEKRRGSTSASPMSQVGCVWIGNGYRGFMRSPCALP